MSVTHILLLNQVCYGCSHKQGYNCLPEDGSLMVATPCNSSSSHQLLIANSFSGTGGFPIACSLCDEPKTDGLNLLQVINLLWVQEDKGCCVPKTVFLNSIFRALPFFLLLFPMMLLESKEGLLQEILKSEPACSWSLCLSTLWAPASLNSPTLHIHQRKYTLRESLNAEHLCHKCKSTLIHERNFTKPQNAQ